MVSINRFVSAIAISVVFLTPLSLYASTEKYVESFAVRDVRLTESPFKHAQDLDICYLLGLDADRLLAPYLREAGLRPKAESYPNWENSGLDGHIGGHYLSALAYMYASTGNEEISYRLDYMLGELKRCQDASVDGYIGGVPGSKRIWTEISEGKIDANGFGLNGAWVPLYNIHKIYAGLRDAYLQAGRETARDMLVKLTDWMLRLTSGLTDSQIQDMLISEHGGLNEIFADVAAITGDDRYIGLARRFSHRVLLEPLIAREDRLTGMHANTQIPKVIGFKRIADLAHDRQWDEASEYFWHTVVGNRSVSIGGNSVCEHFHPSDDFGSMLSSEQGPETCNTYNILRLTKMLYETSGDPRYMDYYERAIYNHILSSQNPVQGGFVYFTPMRPGHYKVYSQPQTSFWCCVGSGMENHARYGETIYSHRGDSLYVNLFIPSILKWGDAEIEQRNAFPFEESTTIVIDETYGKEDFTLFMRCPGWTDRDGVEVTLNGSPFDVRIDNGYICVKREWSRGDSLTVSLPMSLRAERIPDSSSYYSFVYGPLVLAANIGKERLDGLFADEGRGSHVAKGPMIGLDEIPAVISDRNDLLNHFEPDGQKPLSFRLRGLSLPKYEGMILEPFFGLHECRYMVYWPVYTESEWISAKEELGIDEQRKLAIEEITADKVVCGEQQPESDHFVTMEKSSAGDDDGRHWRVASGWFAYKMSTKGSVVKRLRVTFRPEARRDAIVFIDGNELCRFASTSPDMIVSQEFEIPQKLIDGKDKIELRVSRCDMKSTPHVYELRLLAE